MTLKGVDVSHWQDKTPDLRGVSFLIARATIGTKTDGMYSTHIAAARRAGIMTGAYHFNWDTLSVADQVAAFLAKAGKVDFYVLDVEGDHAFSHAQARDFIARVKKTGKRVGLYHSTSGFFDGGQDWNWVADWRGLDKPPIPYDIHQYGLFHGVDGNNFPGTLHQLRELATGVIDMATGIPLIDHATAEGFARVKAGLVGVKAVQIADMEMFGIAAGDGKPVKQTARIHPSFTVDGKPWHAGELVRVIGGPDIEGAIFLDAQVAFEPAPVAAPDCDVPVREAKAPLEAALSDAVATIDAQSLTIATLKTDLAAAPTKERNRIANAEKARINSI